MPPNARLAVIRAASQPSIIGTSEGQPVLQRSPVGQFLHDTMDPDERPLQADTEPGAFFRNLKAGIYDGDPDG